MTGEGQDFVRHLQSLGVPTPDGQPRTSPDRNTEEGALIAFSASLQRRRPLHRFVAWVMLVAMGLPAVLTLLWLSGRLLEWVWAPAR